MLRLQSQGLYILEVLGASEGSPPLSILWQTHSFYPIARQHPQRRPLKKQTPETSPGPRDRAVLRYWRQHHTLWGLDPAFW